MNYALYESFPRRLKSKLWKGVFTLVVSQRVQEALKKANIKLPEKIDTEVCVPIRAEELDKSGPVVRMELAMPYPLDNTELRLNLLPTNKKRYLWVKEARLVKLQNFNKEGKPNDS